MGLIPVSGRSPWEGNSNSLQYSCLENPMDRGAWWAAVHRVAQSQTWLKKLSMHVLEKEMATHSSILAWKIPRTEEPARLQSWGCKELDTTERLHFTFIPNIDIKILNKILANHSYHKKIRYYDQMRIIPGKQNWFSIEGNESLNPSIVNFFINL